LSWWDLDAKQLRTIDFPARTIDVAPNPAMQTAAAVPTVAHHSLVKWIVTGLVTGLILAAIIAWREKLHRILLRWQANWRPIHLQPLNPTS
jgi:hypothetical protein